MRCSTCLVAAGMAALVIGGMSTAAADQIPLNWRTVVNNGDQIPETGEYFARYREPSMNMAGIVVFRAGGSDATELHGVFSREMMTLADEPVLCRVDGSFLVPPPNNTQALFYEFPGLARIDFETDVVATFGLSDPVWLHARGPAMTLQGTSGAYLSVKNTLFTGANMLGDVLVPMTDDLMFPEFAVPHASMGTNFDRFIGSPAITDTQVMVFAGAYRDALSDLPGTGIFFRDVFADSGLSPTGLIANTQTSIPHPTVRIAPTFGWFSAPSAVGDQVVFAGVDYLPSPTIGGIYLATIEDEPVLEPLVRIGDPVPTGETERQAQADLSDGRAGDTFSRFGNAVSFDGRYVAFWAALGYETCAVQLEPPTARLPDLTYCVELYDDLLTVEVPVHQGIFVHDTLTGETYRIADNRDRFADFLYWSFRDTAISGFGQARLGLPDIGTGGVIGEIDGPDGPPIICPQPQSSTYVTVAGFDDGTFRVAFRAKPGTCGDMARHNLPDLPDIGDGRPPIGHVVDGIYLTGGPGFGTPLIVAETAMPGDLFDPEAPKGMFVDAVGLEREGLRAGQLAIAVGMSGMSTEDTEWAGIYLADITDLSWCTGDLSGDSDVGFDDMILMLSNWGPCRGPCPEDLDEDGEVGFGDLVILLSLWGACP